MAYVYLLNGIAALLAVIMVSGCCGVTTRPQPDGGDVINLRQSPQAEKFNRLEKSFHEQINHAEKIAPGSEKVRTLKSEYQKIKRLWEIYLEENIDKLPDTFVNSVGITMKLIKPGTFMRWRHKIIITKPFYIGVYEVTGRQYSKIMGGPDLPSPKVKVSWNEAMAFCRRLSEKEGATYTLPTEAQWEYACRAGTKTRFSFGDQWNRLAILRPNPWGLYDMHGNVWEWCKDWYGDYPSGDVTDPEGPPLGSFRVLRGGSWGGHCILRMRSLGSSWENATLALMSAIRDRDNPSLRHNGIGFRVVRAQ